MKTTGSKAKTTKKTTNEAIPKGKSVKTSDAGKAAKAGKGVATKTGTSAPSSSPRADGRRYWLVKTEPDVFSFDDLMNAPKRTTYWNGVRNYQARNFMRDDMKRGDGVLVYHSNANPPGVAGIAEVAREGYPDHTQFDENDSYFDPKAKPDAPTWIMVDIRGVKPLARELPLPELRENPRLEGMVLLQKGSRLSVQPVTEKEWKEILRMGGVDPDL